MDAAKITTTEVAKLIRSELKVVFPKTAFSVRTNGYASVRVEWTDGPTRQEVEFLLDPFIGYERDASDIYADYGSYKQVAKQKNGTSIHYELQYLSCHRTLSEGLLRQVAAAVCQRYGLELPPITPAVTDGRIHVSASIEYTEQRIGNDTLDQRIYHEAHQTSTLLSTPKSPADKFRKSADTLQKIIDDKRRARPTHTHRMARMAESALDDARNLERLQDKLWALAELWDSGDVPEPLQHVTAKSEVEILLYKRTLYPPDSWGREDYLAMVRIGLGTPQKLKAACDALDQIGKAEAGQKTQADRLADAERAIVLRKIPGFFPTPQAVIAEMLLRVWIEPGMRVLEPSAGKGNLVDVLRQCHPEAQIEVCEINSDLRYILELKGYSVVAADCFEVTEPVYDVVASNPPFEGLADIDHVRHYYTLLKPGGALVSVMSEAAFFRKDKKAEAFREWLSTVGQAHDLPADAFKDSERPTGVKTRFVVIHKPTPEQHYAQEIADGWAELHASGIQIGDTIRMSWGTCPDTYGKVLGFSQDNPAWLSVEEYSSPTKRFTIAVNNCVKVGCTAIVPYHPMPAPEPALTLGILSTYVYTTFQELVDDLVDQLEDDELDLCWDERDYALIFRQNAHLISPAGLMLLALQGETHTQLALSLMGVSDDKGYVPDLIEVWYHAGDIDVWELADWALRNLDKQAHTGCRYLKVWSRWQFALKLHHFMTQPQTIQPAPAAKSVTDVLIPPDRAYTYAVNLSDLDFISDDPLKERLKQVATLPRRNIIPSALRHAQAEISLLAFDCDHKQGWEIVREVRQQFDKSQLRLYKSRTGYGAWQAL